MNSPLGLAGTFSSAFSQIIILYLFAAAGFIMTRFKILPDGAQHTISVLLAKFFLPCMLISTISSGFETSELREYGLYLLLGTLIPLGIWFPLRLIGSSLGKKIDPTLPELGGLLSYALIFPNISYLGYPLAKAALPEVYIPMVIFSLPYTIAANTFGYMLISGEKRNGLRRLLSPPIIGVAAGVVLALLPVKLPSTLNSFMSSASGCMGPLAMLLTGSVVARSVMTRKNSAKHGKNAPLSLLCLLRLVILPAAITGIVALCGVLLGSPALLTALTTVTAASMCLPCGMNMIFIPEANPALPKKIGETGAECALLSNAFGLITVPVIYAAIAFII